MFVIVCILFEVGVCILFEVGVGRDHASFHVSKMTNDYINTQKDWLTIIYLPKKAPYLNPNERKVNQRIKSNICANRFYDHIEEQKTAISEYLDKIFGRWYGDIRYDT